MEKNIKDKKECMESGICGNERFEKDGKEFCLICENLLRRREFKGRIVGRSLGIKSGIEIKSRTGKINEDVSRGSR